MISRDAFFALPHAITLLGMSGVGKTTLASTLRRTGDGRHDGSGSWFHYSADYRIGTRYLAEDILDNIKAKIMRMQDPFVADLLRSDSIYISHNISVENLEPVSTFLGMFGDPGQGGLDRREFLRRQKLYGKAERRSMTDVPHFVERAWRIYQCKNFVNDASGSLCEIADPDDGDDTVLKVLSADTMIIYVRPDRAYEDIIKARAIAHPKPLFYNRAFIDPRLAGLPDSGQTVDPARFAASLFGDLLEFRKARYQKIADRYGLTIDVKDLFADGDARHGVRDADTFLDTLYRLVAAAARSPGGAAKLERYVEACTRRQSARDTHSRS